MCEAVDLLGKTVGIEFLDRGDEAAVQGPASLVEEAGVRHLVGQRVLERVLEIRKEPRLVEKLGGLEIGQGAAQIVLVVVGDRLKERERHVPPDHGRHL